MSASILVQQPRVKSIYGKGVEKVSGEVVRPLRTVNKVRGNVSGFFCSCLCSLESRGLDSVIPYSNAVIRRKLAIGLVAQYRQLRIGFGMYWSH